MYSQIAAERAAACPKPFVKWAGGKRQLIPVLSGSLPVRFERYIEPFLGGGALLFHILIGQGGGSRACLASDFNSELILAYITIRDNVTELIRALRVHEEEYYKDPESYYYKTRDGPVQSDDITRVSRLIFLNRTCFNGLYRVNSSGKFNVPLGRYTKPNIADSENLMAVSRLLQSQRLSISCRDFACVVDEAQKDDLIYFDPPYMPVSKTASFTSYTNGSFTLDEQKRLADVCFQLDEKGCKVMISNSDSEIIENMFRNSGSKSWNIKRVKASRRINSVSGKRSGHMELLIRNY